MKYYLDYNMMTLTLMQSHRGVAKDRIFGYCSEIVITSMTVLLHIMSLMQHSQHSLYLEPQGGVTASTTPSFNCFLHLEHVEVGLRHFNASYCK